MNKYTVITENDISDWKDETGTRYHFPKRYLRLLETGTKVIYYKGKIKDKSFQTKRLSDDPHYFGIAEIGEIWKDGDNLNNYFAEIVNYLPFKKALPFKKKNGDYFEKIPESKKTNYWRDGVRAISKDIYNEIVDSSDLSVEIFKEETVINYENNKTKLTLVDEDLLKYFSKKDKRIKSGNSKPSFNKESKKIGDFGERIVFEYLKANLNPNLLESLVWHANIGETPGYDLSYTDENNNLICIEVKTTSGKLFNNFIMTINEINKAKEIGEHYKIYLVSDCFSEFPKLNILENPTLEENFILEPISFNVYRYK